MRRDFQPAHVLFIVILLIGATSCGARNEAVAASNAGCNNALYPVKQGASWIYSSAGGPDGSFSYTNTVSEIRADGFTLASQINGATRSQEWLCQPDGLKALQLGGGSAAGITTQGMTSNFIASNVTGISLPKEITPGMQWRYDLQMQGAMATPSEQQARSSGSYAVVMQEMGKETVTTPAGAFEAFKLQANLIVDIAMLFEGVELPVKYSGVAMVWYAPGVGYIKSVENGDFGGAAYSVTTELQSYSIP